MVLLFVCNFGVIIKLNFLDNKKKSKTSFSTLDINQCFAKIEQNLPTIRVVLETNGNGNQKIW